MTISTYDPTTTELNLTFTERARQRAEQELASHDARGLRLSIKKAGCSGFRYLLDFVTDPGTNDQAINISDKLTIFVTADACDVVNGTEIDYVTEGLNNSFQFRNPNATGECGCGESFTVN